MDTKGKDILIKIDEVSLCYDDAGNGDVLIFIHGFPFDKSSWDPQVQRFKNSQRVITYDQRGFGKSTRGNEISIEQFADDFIKFLDALQIEKVSACGLSMGGYVLLNAVNRFPERFSSIILADTQCIADSPEGKQKRFNAIKSIEENGLEEYATNSIRNLFTTQTQVNNKTLTENIRKVILSTKPETITATLKALAERDESCSILESIRIPTLIICGKEDPITPVGQSELLQSGIKGSELKIIDSAAHLSNLEQVDIFNSSIETFLLRVVSHKS